MREFNYRQIASICHAANRAYCETIGDFSQLTFDSAPEWQRNSAMDGVEFHIKALLTGQKPSPAASHEAWLEAKRLDGWKFGVSKDVDKKEHPCFRPYNDLPIEQRMKDYIFGAIVEAFFNASKES